MKKLILAPLLALSASALLAQDITGTWQGTLQAGGRDLRIVYQISKADAGGLKAVMFSIDQAGGQPIPVGTVTFQAPTLKMAVPAIGGNYEGKLSNTDATAMTGTWTQGPAPLPLNLTHATDKTAWAIPDPPAPPKVMAADAKPSFEVATIKPAKPDQGMSFLVNRSGMLNSTGTTLSFLIKFAYDVHPRQISKGPAWFETEKYDITAKPDVEGIPSLPQLKMMVQKLLAERFQLSFHRDKKELPVYGLSVAKTGVKMTKDDSNPNSLPGFGGGGVRGLNVRNSTMEEFAGFLQSNVLEQPVVDQTGLAGARYDFLLKWTPDASQTALGGGPPAAASDVDAPPDLFAAVTQQLGLKIESTKATVDVLVIDKVEKPSDN